MHNLLAHELGPLNDQAPLLEISSRSSVSCSSLDHFDVDMELQWYYRPV